MFVSYRSFYRVRIANLAITGKITVIQRWVEVVLALDPYQTVSF